MREGEAGLLRAFPNAAVGMALKSPAGPVSAGDPAPTHPARGQRFGAVRVRHIAFDCRVTACNPPPHVSHCIRGPQSAIRLVFGPP
jgi:hypothetical protein